MLWEFVIYFENFLFAVRISYLLGEFPTRCQDFTSVVKIFYRIGEFIICCENFLLAAKITYLSSESPSRWENFLLAVRPFIKDDIQCQDQNNRMCEYSYKCNWSIVSNLFYQRLCHVSKQGFCDCEICDFQLQYR